MTQTHLYKVSKVVKETPDTVSIQFTGPIKAYLAGQFVMLSYVDPKSGKLSKRAYSLSSSPHEEFLETCVKAMPEGYVSIALQDVKVGDEFELSNPMGRFVFEEQVDKDLVFLAAGSGITPFISMLKYIAHKDLKTPAHLFFSNKTQEDIICRSRLDALAANNENIQVTHVLTREAKDSGWEGRRERIDLDYLKEVVGSFDGKVFFLCGPLAFVKSLRDQLKEAGLAPYQLKFEIYG